MRNACFVVVTSVALFGAAACSGTSSVGLRTSDGGEADDESSDSGEVEVDGSREPESSRVDGGATSSGDADTKPTPSSCQSDQTYDGPQGNCTLQSTYQCESPKGFDAFRVACSCPSATCGCYTNGTLTKTVPFNGCPACASPVELAKLCGVAGY